MTQLERVPASRLRPGDVLYACDTSLQLRSVKVGERRVHLTSPWGHSFSVPKTCQFKRTIKSRRIEMGRKAKRGAE